MHARRFAPSLLVCLLAACAIESTDSAEPGSEAQAAGGESFGTVEQQLLECPDWACGQNGPSLNNRSFHELSELGDLNKEGFAMSGLVKNGLVYSARVVGSRLSGVRTGSPALAGAALVGAYFWVVQADTGYLARVYVSQVIQVPLWGGPKRNQLVEAYRLMWDTPFDERRTNLCSNPPREAKPQSPELLNLPGEFTLLFEGNRYDAKSKRLLPGDRNFFNIACASHALSKLFLTGLTNLTGDASEAQQQAALKMITADYCGDGTSFTLGGEPLYWRTANGYMDFYGNPTTLEARWDDKGAVCLDAPRLKTSKNPLAPQVFPEIWEAVRAHCPLAIPPPCTPSDPYKLEGALVVSANPINE